MDLSVGETLPFPCFPVGHEHFRVESVCTEGNSSLPRLKERDKLPVNLPQYRGKLIPPECRWGGGNLADGYLWIGVVRGLACRVLPIPLRSGMSRFLVNR